MRPGLRIGVLVGALVALWVLASSLYTVSEGEQVLIVRQGAPIGAIKEPGLNVKIPLVDSVISYDARLLTLEPPPEQVILGDQKRIVVQAYTRYRIANPLRFNQSVQTLQIAAPQLGQIVSSALRRVLGQVALPSLLSAQRVGIVDQIQAEVADKARAMGLEVAEVRLHRADLPLETSQAIYDRMKSERQREAKELRAQGFEWAQEIQAKAERERTVTLSEAQRQARITRGEADGAANSILAQAFGQDPAFYRLYRSLQTYRQALADTGATLVLSPDSAFLHSLKAGPDAAPHK
ncbi:MAG TPA: protease modulator HflC [Burkholderiaceae bacterium]